MKDFKMNNEIKNNLDLIAACQLLESHQDYLNNAKYVKTQKTIDWTKSAIFGLTNSLIKFNPDYLLYYRNFQGQ